MKTEFTRQFLKDLDKINQAAVKKNIQATIEEVEKAKSLPDIRNIKKLTGHKIAYRIRCGDYRIGLLVENSIVEFVRLAHRKDVYNIFP